MPGQMSPAPPPPPELAQLEALLVTLHRTRSSLPALLAAVSTSAAHSPHDRTALYRAASTECTTAVRALGDRLDHLEGVLAAADHSANRDQSGIVLRSAKVAPPAPQPEPVQPARAEKKPWVALGDILHGGADATTTTPPTPTSTAKGKGKARAPYTPQLDPPTSPAALGALARTWEAQHARVRVRVGGDEKGLARRPRRLEVVLDGVLRAAVGLRWEARGDGAREGEVCEVDWVVCHGLAEEVRPPSSSPSWSTPR